MNSEVENDPRAVINVFREKAMQDVIISIRNTESIIETFYREKAFSELSPEGKERVLQKVKKVDETLAQKCETFLRLKSSYDQKIEQLNDILRKCRQTDKPSDSLSLFDNSKLTDANNLITKINTMRRIVSIFLSSEIPKDTEEGVDVLKALKELQTDRDLDCYKKSSLG